MRTNNEEIADILILSKSKIERAMYMTLDEALDERGLDLKVIAMDLEDIKLKLSKLIREVEDINYKNKKR